MPNCKTDLKNKRVNHDFSLKVESFAQHRTHHRTLVFLRSDLSLFTGMHTPHLLFTTTAEPGQIHVMMKQNINILCNSRSVDLINCFYKDKATPLDNL